DHAAIANLSNAKNPRHGPHYTNAKQFEVLIASRPSSNSLSDRVRRDRRFCRDLASVERSETATALSKQQSHKSAKCYAAKKHRPVRRLQSKQPAFAHYVRKHRGSPLSNCSVATP